jgi:hypothetical protein
VAGVDISTGQMAAHNSGLLPLDASGLPGVVPPTPVSGLQTPADQGPVRDLTEERLGQLSAYEQDITNVMHSGMTDENDRRSGYQGPAVSPPGDTIGTLMNLPPGYPDAGTVGGLTDPEASFYDPPRGGAPETFTGQQQ